MIPKIITQFWSGGRLPSRYIRFVESVKAHHPGWKHSLLGESDAERLTGKSWAELKRTYGTYCSISNLVRLLAIVREGGVYIDVDCECIKPLDPLMDCAAFTAIVDNHSIQGSQGRICCAVFGAVPDHPWVKWQLANISKVHVMDSEWGVPLMSMAPRDGLTLVPTETFYPWHWEAKPDQMTVKPETRLIHHWDGDWRACL